MTKSDYLHALRLLDTTVALLKSRTASPTNVRRRLRSLSRECALLRTHLGQPAPRLQRN